ncbi:MAG: DUF4384 domain-containing protein [Deltaproteobacteria bacterium]|nr:DUF4384 domain-containing protein [Deltaproteobacteria bacterium]
MTLDRQGHLTELALDRLEADPPASDPSFFEAARAHLAGCEPCRARVDLRRRDALTIAPSARVVAAWRSRHAARRGHLPKLVGVGGALAVAALVLIVARAPPAGDDDAPRKKGASLHLEVHVHDGARARLVGDGDRIRAGDRAAFGVRPERDGHLLVFGWDATGAPYAIWPMATDPRAAVAQPIARMEATLPLPAAIRFDGTPGAEHLMAVLCPEPFSLADLLPPDGLGASEPRVPAACARRRVVLHKTP